MSTDDKRMRTKLLEMARKDMQTGDVRRAVRHYKRLVALEPENPGFLLKLGDLSLRGRNERDAVDAYSRAGSLYARESFDEKAIALYKRALELDSTRYEVWNAVADCYLRLNRREEALASLTIAAEALTREERTDEATCFRQRIAELGGVEAERTLDVDPDPDFLPSKDERFHERIEEALEHARTGQIDLLPEAFHAAVSHRPAHVAELRELFTGLDMSDVDAVKEALRAHLAEEQGTAGADRTDMAALLGRIQDCRTYLDGMEILYRQVSEIYRESVHTPEGT